MSKSSDSKQVLGSECEIHPTVPFPTKKLPIKFKGYLLGNGNGHAKIEFGLTFKSEMKQHDWRKGNSGISGDS